MTVLLSSVYAMQNYNAENNSCSALTCTSSGYVRGKSAWWWPSHSDQTVPGGGYDCVPPELLRSEPNGAIISNLFLINAFLIGFIGILGNLLTVATIVNAKRNHREEFRIFSHSSTPLLIHLAICDILYCAGRSFILNQNLLHSLTFILAVAVGFCAQGMAYP